MNPLRQVKRALENRLIARFADAEKAASRAGDTETLPAGAGTMLLDPDALLRASEARREPLSVAIIIPSKDHPEYLSRCIDALFATIDPERDRLTCEIVVVDNGSNSKNQIIINEILNTERQKEDGITCRYLYREEPFHFGRMCNRGAAETESDLLLFLNDDTKALDSGWLAKMTACVLLPQTGAVGAKLLYPRGEDEDTARIQHCGIVNTRCGPVHKLNRLPDRKGYFLEYNRGVHRVSAVTGACLLIRRAIFDEAGGFDEAFPVSFNDVDLCFTLFEKGYTNLCCNEARLTHYESASRGDDALDVKKMIRLQREYRTLVTRHAGMTGRDPFYPEGLTEGCDIAPEIRAEKEPLPYALPYAVKQGVTGRLKHMRQDDCVRVGVEYAGPAENWLGADEKREADGRLGEGDIWIRGYSFVSGADNALYEKKLLIERLREAGDGYAPAEMPPVVFSVRDIFRPEIVLNVPDQAHVAFSGFAARIEKRALSPGVYRIGVIQSKRYARQTLFNMGQTILLVEEDDG